MTQLFISHHESDAANVRELLDAAEARMSEPRIDPPCLVIVRPLPPGLPSALSAEQWMHALATSEATVGIGIGGTRPRVTPPPDGLLTPAEAARKLRCSIKTLNAHVAAGDLSYVSMGKGTKRIRRMFTDAVLDEFIANQTRKDHPCPSTPSRARHTSTSTSASEVIAFTGQPRPRPGAKQKK